MVLMDSDRVYERFSVEGRPANDCGHVTVPMKAADSTPYASSTTSSTTSTAA